MSLLGPLANLRSTKLAVAVPEIVSRIRTTLITGSSISVPVLPLVVSDSIAASRCYIVGDIMPIERQTRTVFIRGLGASTSVEGSTFSASAGWGCPLVMWILVENVEAKSLGFITWGYRNVETTGRSGPSRDRLCDLHSSKHDMPFSGQEYLGLGYICTHFPPYHSPLSIHLRTLPRFRYPTSSPSFSLPTMSETKIEGDKMVSETDVDHLEKTASYDSVYHRNVLSQDAAELKGYWSSWRLIGSVAAITMMANSLFLSYSLPVS
jgi:hypothetical protein